MKELNEIQCKLHAPKDLENKFGGYKYRSLESILEAVKPLLKESGCTITFSDDLVLVGERYYVKATATLTTPDGTQISSTAFAREQEQKKGMDEAQVTGSASSYARKYAVCSLLAIDDNREPDMLDNREEGQKEKASKKPSAKKPVSAPAQEAAPAKPKIFCPEDYPTAWNSAVQRAKTTGDITRLDIEDRGFIVTPENWERFTKEINS